LGQQANLYGPPGSGKTRRLIHIAESVVRERGPAALGAVTFTRTAARELKERLAPLVGAQNHPNLDLVFPHVGTIHSLCYRLIGRPQVISNKQRAEWAKSVGDVDASFDGIDRVDWLDTFDLGDPGRSLAASALSTYSAARQRLLTLDDGWMLLAQRDPHIAPLESVIRLVKSYEAYKHENGVIDFEDMLDEGLRERLPVEYLLVDEAQDNSALLWSVIRAWRAWIAFTIAAGDPYQAIFRFMGADPSLFRNQDGGWSTIDDSHRLTDDAARFALRTLQHGGYADDPLLSTWQGVGDGSVQDGSSFYLARTGTLVEQMASDLYEQGIPYAYLSGRKGPLGPEPTRAWRAAQELLSDDSIDAQGLLSFAKGLKRGTLNPPDQRWIETVAREDPTRRVSRADLPWSGALEMLINRLPNAGYYQRVVRGYGYGALIMPPATRVGTIHSAKGREADHVHLVRNWGTLPGRAMLEGDMGEVCVAYVGASRHRVGLDMVDLPLARGIDYPFPSRATVAA